MSNLELSRHQVMQRLNDKRLTQQEAAAILGLSTRQVKRLARAFRREGVNGLVSKRRGRPSNHQLPLPIKEQAIDLIRHQYHDFGPTLAHEKLVEIHHLTVSRESVRQLMIGDQLWHPKRARLPVIHQMRLRRACYGELVQIDGSPHDWFEGRAPRCTLLVFIDDATGRLVQLLFVPQETTFAYFAAAHKYFLEEGKPVAFYSDRDSVFRINKEDALAGSGLTQFGRAMQELAIDIICANTPQAKGRVERVNQTLQDRLVKELRLRGISEMEEANEFLPEFITSFNRRFAVAPRSERNLHRRLQPTEDVDRILTLQETRVLSKNLTLQYNKVIYQIQTTRPSYTLRKVTVTVCENSHGEITLLYKGQALAYTIYHQQQRQSEITPPKLIDATLEHGSARRKAPHVPPPDHPWRHFSYGTNAIPK